MATVTLRLHNAALRGLINPIDRSQKPGGLEHSAGQLFFGNLGKGVCDSRLHRQSAPPICHNVRLHAQH